MRKILIERNKNAAEIGYAGTISGETDDGRKWVMFLDANGAPDVFWPERDDDGTVRGQGIDLGTKVRSMTRGEGGLLEREVGSLVGIRRDQGEQLVSTFPVWTPETWPRQEGDDPTDYTGLPRGVVFCIAQPGQAPSEAMRTFVRELHEFYCAEDRLLGDGE